MCVRRESYCGMRCNELKVKCMTKSLLALLFPKIWFACLLVQYFFIYIFFSYMCIWNLFFFIFFFYTSTPPVLIISLKKLYVCMTALAVRNLVLILLCAPTAHTKKNHHHRVYFQLIYKLYVCFASLTLYKFFSFFLGTPRVLYNFFSIHWHKNRVYIFSNTAYTRITHKKKSATPDQKKIPQ